jgi:hypothetical protein
MDNRPAVLVGHKRSAQHSGSLHDDCEVATTGQGYRVERTDLLLEQAYRVSKIH